MTKGWFRCIGVVILFIVLLSGAASAADLVVLFQGQAKDQFVMEEILAQYEAEYGAEVDLIFTGTSWNALYERFLILSLSGVPIDVVKLDKDWKVNGDEELLLDLRKLAAEYEVELDFNAYYPQTLEFFSLGDAVYGLPIGVFPVVLYYNEQLFAYNAVVPPATDWESERWDWDEFVAAAVKLTADLNGDGRTDQWGLGYWAWQSGASMWGKGWLGPNLELNFLEPESIAGMKRALELMLDYGAQANQATIHGLGAGWDGFGSDRLGMNSVGAYLIPQYAANVIFDWNIGVHPKGTNPRTTSMSVDAVGIGATTQNPAQALHLLQYLAYNTDSATAVFAGLEFVPPLKELGPVWSNHQSFVYPSLHVSTILQAVNYVELDHRYLHPKAAELVAVEFPRELIEAGRLPLELALEEYARQLRRVLDRE